MSVHSEIMDLRRLLDSDVRLQGEEVPSFQETCKNFVQRVVSEHRVKAINGFPPTYTEPKDTPVQRKSPAGHLNPSIV